MPEGDGGGGGGGGLGRIVGIIDMLGEDENRVSNRTFVQADDGPFTNFRIDTVNVPTPSEGPFELENLVPSNASTPARGHRVWGDMNFHFDRRSEYFRTPFLNGANGRVFVSAGLAGCIVSSGSSRARTSGP